MSGDFYQAHTVLCSVVRSYPDFPQDALMMHHPRHYKAHRNVHQKPVHLLTATVAHLRVTLSLWQHVSKKTGRPFLHVVTKLRTEETPRTVCFGNDRESDMFDGRQTLISEQMALGSHTGPSGCVCQLLEYVAAKRRQSYPHLKVIQKRHNYSSIYRTIAYDPATLKQCMQVCVERGGAVWKGAKSTFP